MLTIILTLPMLAHTEVAAHSKTIQEPSIPTIEQLQPLSTAILNETNIAQVPVPVLPNDRPDPLPEVPEEIEPLPPPEELLEFPAPSLPDSEMPSVSESEEVVTVRQFEVLGSTVFTEAEFATALVSFLNRPLTFEDLLEARDTITQLYVDRGYITSGAFIPADQIVEDGIVTLQVLEGQVAEINVEGSDRLQPGYIESRLAIASSPPLNIQELLEGLQVLQLNPVIETISAELVATPQPGENDLIIQVQEADTFSLDIQLSNAESPLLETFQQRIIAKEENLTGYGDSLELTYQHAGRSDLIEVDYQLPISPHNTILGLNYTYTDTEVLEEPLSLISPRSAAHTWEIGISHPLIETPQDNVSLSLSLGQRFGQSYIQPPGLPEIRFGFPGSGATEDGLTQLTVLEFGQEWQHRTSNQLLFVDSRFRLGTNLLGATGSSEPTDPSPEFFAWQGQALWLQRFASDWLLVMRAAGQVSDRPLVSSELFSLGGINSVRGYRKDEVSADSGVVASLEVQAPILRWPEQDAIAFIAPFVDYGFVWNQDDQFIQDQSLAAIGTGLIFQISDNFTARLDYALPLIDTDSDGDTLQESGFLFVINLNLL